MKLRLHHMGVIGVVVLAGHAGAETLSFEYSLDQPTQPGFIMIDASGPGLDETLAVLGSFAFELDTDTGALSFTRFDGALHVEESPGQLGAQLGQVSLLSSGFTLGADLGLGGSLTLALDLLDANDVRNGALEFTFEANTNPGLTNQFDPDDSRLAFGLYGHAPITGQQEARTTLFLYGLDGTMTDISAPEQVLVPLPGAAGLAGVSLAGLAFRRRRSAM